MTGHLTHLSGLPRACFDCWNETTDPRVLTSLPLCAAFVCERHMQKRFMAQNAYPSNEAMVAALRELRTEVQEAYPDADWGKKAPKDGKGDPKEPKATTRKRKKNQVPVKLWTED